MVVCLEKTEGNSDFHEIVDFLTSSSIHHALTVSPPIYTSYIKQFWNTASSQTLNDVKQINATIDSKAVVVTEAFWNEFSINIASAVICLATNQKFNFSKLLFDGMLRNLDNTKKKFLMYPRKGLNFSGNITPLFPNMLTHATEGKGSGEPTEPQPTPSPTQPSGHTSDKAEGALNLQELYVLCTNLSNKVLILESIKDAQAAELSALKSRIKKLEKKCKPIIFHHRAWLKSGRKKSKPESTLDDSTAFDDQDANHGMEYMETEEAVDEGRQSSETKEVKLIDDTDVVENKGSSDKGGNAKELVSTARPEVSTTRPYIDAARQEDSAVKPRNPPTTTSIFKDEDITMAQTLIKMKEEKAKEKGVSIKDVEDSSRPARSTLTLKPLPTIDPKDKGKSILKEPKPAKKMTRSDFDDAQIARDAEIARQLQMYDEVQPGIDADALFAAKLQQEEREEYIIKERAKFLAETITAQRKFRAAQRSA
ncbi:hypothetical protein Tco_0885472 [Tanacetum coccineum]